MVGDQPEASDGSAMSTNRVGDGQRAERRVEEDRRQKRQQGTRREEGRKFSQMLQKRERPSADRRGDERGRKLREGTAQKGHRQERAGRNERLQAQRREPGEKKGRSREASTTERKEGKRAGRESIGDDGAKDDASDGLEARALAAGDDDCRRATSDGVREVQAKAEGAEQAQTMEASKGKNAAIEEVARQIVDAVRVGEDSRERRVVFLDVTVPGRGDVRIRLRRDGGGMEVRMRAGNDALARSLQEGVGELRERGADKGISFTSIQVVR